MAAGIIHGEKNEKPGNEKGLDKNVKENSQKPEPEIFLRIFRLLFIFLLFCSLLFFSIGHVTPIGHSDSYVST